MIRTPAFWHQPEPNIIARLLAPLGAIYGAITLRRMRQQGVPPGIPVIAIGNFTVGGGGKTPTTIALAKYLKHQDERPFVITRGYGGALRGPVLVENGRHDARQVGDEALILARHAPTIVARERVEGARFALKKGASVILLDDALQNPSLQRTLSIAVIDGGIGIGNGLCLPAGPLRAPLVRSLPFVDLVMIIGDDKRRVLNQLSGVDVCFSAMVPDEAISKAISGQRLYAFAGIARPEKFFATLAEAGGLLVGQHAFADHHPFTEDEAGHLMAEAAAKQAVLITTEKDHVRLTGGSKQRELAAKSLALPIDIPLPKLLSERVQLALSEASRAKTASGLA
jgi:tetraacyldisaccharide 4'-kinase